MRYKVGDKVRVKDWNELLEKFGIIRVGARKAIRCKFCFTPDMGQLCGDTLTIKEVIDDNAYRVEEKRGFWSDDMFEDIE